jgi:hypothetical protein
MMKVECRNLYAAAARQPVIHFLHSAFRLLPLLAFILQPLAFCAMPNARGMTVAGVTWDANSNYVVGAAITNQLDLEITDTNGWYHRLVSGNVYSWQ